MPCGKRIRPWYRATPVSGCVALLCVHSIALSGEIVVQNDSVTGGGNAFIVGDFVAGEQAAAWLTSPCDGAIVGVQIFWLSNDPGAQQVIHQNIRIRRAGAFPTPGDVLEELDSPVLIPGFLNEFRTIDEQGALLDVPVVTGQTFVMSLQYAEPTDIVNGTPSVVRDIDGCQSGKNALFDFNVGWIDFCFFLQGDLFIRAVVDCGAPTGACCLPSGECAGGLTAAACGINDGTYRGDGVDCQDVQCPQPTVACCFSQENCLDLTAVQCTVAAGFSAGPGTECDSTECFASGACCLPAGDCVDNAPAEICPAVGGTFQGPGTTCNEVSCPQPEGACCFNNDFGTNCFDLEETDCAVITDSNWAGPFTTCLDSDANGISDACECGDNPQDWDGDCDVDMDDFANFAECASPGGPMSGPLCQCFDIDDDDEAGLLEFAAFQIAYTGPGGGCP